MTEYEALFNKLVKTIEEANEKQTQTLKAEIHTEVAQVKIEIAKVKTEISNLKDIIQFEKERITKLESTQRDLENKYFEIERELKKNNIVIFGVDSDSSSNLGEFIVNNLNSWLGINLTLACVNNIYPIGKSKKRPIIVKFLSFFTKLEVLRACKKLKGTGISIAEDLSKEERDIKRTLVKHKKLAQSKGHKVYIRKNILFINDEPYTTDQLEKPNNADVNEQNLKITTIGSNSAPPTPCKSTEGPEFYRQEAEDEEDVYIDIEENEQGSGSEKVNQGAKPTIKKRKIGTAKCTGPVLRKVKNTSSK